MECHLITYLLSRNRHFFHFSSLFAQSVISITRIVIARTSDTSHDHLSTKFTTVLAYGNMTAFRRSLLVDQKKMDSLLPPDKKKRTEINKRANARRDPAERSPHFSQTIEVKKDQRSRLEAIKQRINNAKSALGIDRSTSSTQNADLMERLLSYFEMIRPSAVESSSSSSTKTNVLQGPTTSPSNPVQPSPSSGEVPVQQRTRKRQIYVESTVDDGCYVCTKSSLQALLYKDQGFGYVSVVQELCNKTMADARAEVQATQDYITSGNCIITDARHDSSRSAVHSTVTAISMSNKKIISVCNWSCADERRAPSREVSMTKQLVTNLTETEGKNHEISDVPLLVGYNITEVAHDCVRSLKNWFEQRGIKNSFNTWHGTKGVACDMKKVCSDAQRDEGKTWFSELVDKAEICDVLYTAKATKTHFYWAMRNNDGTDAGFQQYMYLLNIVDHYQCRDTFYIETFHVVVLIYAPKRINFGDKTYVMRVHLAILDLSLVSHN
ncbi:uncharacterized protein [Montipora foliosa]|uniref:uncharacterized protein n=1 Tax=Montipora foliosa TaxID=591990 RepID=UPI0035F15F99